MRKLLGKIYKWFIVIMTCILVIAGFIYGRRNVDVAGGKIENSTENMGSRIKADNDNKRKKIALTFDDGPGKYTIELLDGLKERKVHATFFLIGENAESNKDIVERMHKEGHIIGNHTYSHVPLKKNKCYDIEEEILKTNQILHDYTGETTKYIRPPYGIWNCKIAALKGLSVVIWNVDPMDWSVRNTEKIKNHILKNVKDGSIILLHDVYKTSLDAALQIIDELSEQGYEFVTIDRMPSIKKGGIDVIK